MKDDVDVRKRVFNRDAIAQIPVRKLGVAVDPGRLTSSMRVRFEVIENSHTPSSAHEQVGDMRSDEPGAASNKSALSTFHRRQSRSPPSRAISSAKNFVVIGAMSPREFPPNNSSHKR